MRIMKLAYELKRDLKSQIATSNDWHQNVMAALELVREEVQRADRQIREAGSREMANGDKKIARLALQYSDKLDDFMFQLEKVGDSWQEIQETIDADRPEVQEVVLPTKIRATKGGYSRKVSDVAPLEAHSRACRAEPLMIGISSPGKSYWFSSSLISISERSRSLA